jgi:hypothetical protein
MDALKRAEKARQKQVSEQGAGGGEGAGETQGLSLDPLEAGREPAPTPPGGQSRAEESLDASLTFDLAEAEFGSDTGDLSFEPGDQAAPPAGGRGEPEPGGESPAEGSGRFALVDDLDLDDPAATLPSIKAAQASVDHYFDGTRSGSLSIEQAQIEPLEAADTLTAEREALRERNAARNVFDAKAPPRRSVRHWAGAGFLLIVLLAVVAGGVLMYWDELGELLGARPSVVARRQPMLVTPTPSAPAAASAPQGTSPTGSAGPAVAPAEPVSPVAAGFPSPAPVTAGPVPPAAGPASTRPMQGALSLGQLDEPQAETSPPESPSREPSTATSSVPEPPPVSEVLGSGRSATVAAAAPAALPLALQPGMVRDGDVIPGSIRISRRSKPAKVPPMLEQGFRAYQAGDDEAARAAYGRVLKSDRDNRDANLGLAALAVRGQQWELAHQLYMRVLSRNPRDSHATAGLLAITENVDPVAAESRVKTLLAAEPDAAHLHFALGNLYARQERWPEAQEAYFNAYRHDSGNADYAFNLAVSLDRLVQLRSALDYYRTALDLAARRPASFDTALVTERIRTMTAADGS